MYVIYTNTWLIREQTENIMNKIMSNKKENQVGIGGTGLKEVKAEGLQVQGQPWQLRSLSYTRNKEKQTKHHNKVNETL